MAIELQASTIKTLAGYDVSQHGVETADLDTAISVAVSRAQILLCDETLTADALPEALAPMLADLTVWTLTNKTTDGEVQSETVENYSYTKASDLPANAVARIREKYGDVIKAFSKCPKPTTDTAKFNPLWTPDFYRENRGDA